jgi:hypothetical protein
VIRRRVLYCPARIPGIELPEVCFVHTHLPGHNREACQRTGATVVPDIKRNVPAYAMNQNPLYMAKGAGRSAHRVGRTGEIGNLGPVLWSSQSGLCS